MWGILTCGPLTAEDRRNQWVATGWLLVWQAMFVATVLLADRGTIGGLSLWAAVAATTAVGVATVLVYRRFILHADELMRKIQLDALAIGFGVGMVVAVTLEMVGSVAHLDLTPIHPMLGMVVSYAIAATVAQRRYA